MKIIISIATLNFAGAERVVSIIANELSRQGHDVEILLFYDREICYEINENVKIVVSEKCAGKPGLLTHLRWRRHHIKESGADAVVSFLAPFNMINILTMAGVKIPLIVADRNDPRKIPTKVPLRAARNFLYRFADGIVLQNETNKNYFSKAVRKKSTVIFNPLNMGEYEGAAARCDENDRIDEIVAVGRLIRQKNPEMLLNAFANLASDFPKYRLSFIGEGDMREKLLEMAKEKNIADRVELNGAVSNVFERTHKSKLYVMTSEYEGMPNALIEAMCLGLPVISTKVSGAVDVIENKKNGVLIDCGDEKALEKEMRELLSNAELRQRYGENATKIADQLRTEEIVSRWLEFINETIAKKA